MMFRCIKGHDGDNVEIWDSDDMDMKITVFWDVMSCSVVDGYLHCSGSWWPQTVGTYLPDYTCHVSENDCNSNIVSN
jgi:hypothetical protein